MLLHLPHIPNLHKIESPLLPAAHPQPHTSSMCNHLLNTSPLQVRYLERYSQKAAASAGRTTVVRVDAAGVAQPADGAGAGARGNRYQCGPFSLEVGGGRAGGGGAAGGAGGGGPLPANVVTTGAGGMRSRGGRKGAANQVMACFGVGWVQGGGWLGAGAALGPHLSLAM